MADHLQRAKTSSLSDDDRFCNPISRTELERRWAAARAEMKSVSADVLIVQGANVTGGGGYYRWFTGLSAGVGNPNTIIFPLQGLMTLVCHGDDGGERTLTGEEPEFQGIGRRITVPNFPMAGYLVSLDPRTVAREISDAGFGKIALVGGNNMNFGFGAQLRAALPSREFIDLTTEIDLLKAVKSAEEIEFVRAAALIQDDIMAKLCDHIRDGMRDFELGAYAQYLGQLSGSEAGHFHVASAPVDQPVVFKHRQQQGRRIRKNDIIFFQCENSGPAGYFVHVGRPYVLGKIPSDIRTAFQKVLDAQDFTVELLRTGPTGRELFKSYNTYLSERGLPLEKRLHCHAQGYDTVERPLARPEEDAVICPGMNIGLHPGFMLRGKFMSSSDNYLVGSDGDVERLHRTPREIYEL